MPSLPSNSASAVPEEAVGPLIRGITVLRRLTEAGGRRSPGELVRATGLARSTVDRILSTLQRMDYLRLDGRDAVLAPRLMELGNAYLAATRLPDLLGPHADRLADLLDESVSIAVPDRDGVRFVHQATRRRALSLSFRIGDLLPAERTAPGPLFAADWSPQDWSRWRQRRAADPEGLGFPAAPPRILDDRPSFEERTAGAGEQGWSLDDQLIEPGLVAVALPVRDLNGRQLAAVSVVSHTSRHSAAELRDTVLPRLRNTVTAMEQELHHSPSRQPAPPEPAPGLADWTAASKQELGPEFVESLARGLTVLTAFGSGRAELPLTAVAAALGLPRATARRALITLEHLGCVSTDGRSFRPTSAVLGLGFAPLSRLSLPQLAQPHLAALAAQVHDSASLAVLTGADIQYTARAATGRVMSVDIAVGVRLPAYATSMGRVLLAGLPAAEQAERLAGTPAQPLTRHTVTGHAELADLLKQVAGAGHALVDQELEQGLRSIAVPVRDRTGRLVAAAGLSTHAGRHTLAECRDQLLPALRQAAARIEADLATAGRYARVPPQ
ncbi:IclR family transcriptional regulator C-terminal domain-containing protein [Streptacidiphilus sp. N1-3]|uniref:IclR family transcriptional regulator C-terminal domain-containing protein n=1 Tax=Streptacidiphilus alkalitolerans TaxID=3342712 RepID=A0ABV6X292_9ACTN